MLKIYCQDCGSPTAYSNTKPKFCSSCGKSFEKNVVVNPVQLQKPTVTKPQDFKTKKPTLMSVDNYDSEDDIYDEEDSASVPDINKLDFEVAEIKPSKIKMKDIISNIPEELLSDKGQSKTLKHKKSKKNYKIKNQEFLNEFKAEAGTLRPSKLRNKTDG